MTLYDLWHGQRLDTAKLAYGGLPESLARTLLDALQPSPLWQCVPAPADRVPRRMACLHHEATRYVCEAPQVAGLCLPLDRTEVPSVVDLPAGYQVMAGRPRLAEFCHTCAQALATRYASPRGGQTI